MSGNVLVTGGAGYVGSHACKALAHAGYTPITYDNLSVGNRWAVRWGPLELGDTLDPSRIHEVVRRYHPVAIMHFAALALVGESMQDPAIYYRINVGGAINLLDAARAHGVGMFVFSSSCATYGIPDDVPVREDAPQRPVNPYGSSKLMVERILADYEMAYGIRYAALRYFNAAGADREGELGECRHVETHLIPLVLDTILGERPLLRVNGGDYPTPDGTAIRDYIHVADLAYAHTAALRHLLSGGRSLRLNLGTGVGHSVREVLTMAETVTGRTVPAQIGPRRPGDPPTLVADPGNAMASLGLEACSLASLQEIIGSAWQWHIRRKKLNLLSMSLTEQPQP